ncbi:hypothetical protein J3459_007585 [Metarhizium acridum]|nr:hypothetical protein J3459_007616 [Metarhizium acridum]KAG8427038.1 hypothetical protein J3459_007585 [Metarhizium acridum]
MPVFRANWFLYVDFIKSKYLGAPLLGGVANLRIHRRQPPDWDRSMLLLVMVVVVRMRLLLAASKLGNEKRAEDHVRNGHDGSQDPSPRCAFAYCASNDGRQDDRDARVRDQLDMSLRRDHFEQHDSAHGKTGVAADSLQGPEYYAE